MDKDPWCCAGDTDDETTYVVERRPLGKGMGFSVSARRDGHKGWALRGTEEEAKRMALHRLNYEANGFR